MIDLRDILGSDKRCAECAEDGREIQLEATMAYLPSQRVYADVWECPECGHTVLRGEDPTLYTPDGEVL